MRAGACLPRSADDTCLALIGKGATKLVALDAADREQIAAFNFAGDLVVVPGRGPHTYLLQSLVYSEVTILPYCALRAAVARDAEALAQLLDNADAALARCRERALLVGRKAAAERLTGFLVMMAARIGVARGRAIELDLPMSRRDIGNSLGLTIETVSRQFSHLRHARQIITKGRSKVVLCDLAGLRDRAGHLDGPGSAFSYKFALDQC